MRLFLIILCIAFVSCYKSIDKPNDLLSKDDMVLIISDLYIYKQNSLVNPPTNGAINFDEINGFIAQKYKISPIQYKNSYSYYLLDNEIMIDIYDEVKENLEDKIENIKKDSIE